MRDTTALPVLTVTSRDCPKGHTHDPEEAGTPCLCWLPTTRRWRCRPVGGKAGLSMAMQIPWRRCRPLCACFAPTPTCGVTSRPTSCTAMEGPALAMALPRSSMSERALPTEAPARTMSPPLSVPACQDTDGSSREYIRPGACDERCWRVRQRCETDGSSHERMRGGGLTVRYWREGGKV